MKSPGVRKGAWSTDEDLLLKRCIEMHGEGKWHLVPQRAGLNRCRKSCRLRWLNYLQPNLNKEEFKEDEIDLIIKMHKLLGNRWSLIAGRLPRRTANDIKNYWNSNLRKKLSSKPDGTQKRQPKMKRYEVIRPQPRYFNSKVLSHGQTTANIPKPQQQEEEKNLLCMLTPSEQLNMWWDELLVEDDKYSTDTNEQIILKDHIVGGSVEAMDPERMKFDCNALQWDDLLNMNTWLMK